MLRIGFPPRATAAPAVVLLFLLMCAAAAARGGSAAPLVIPPIVVLRIQVAVRRAAVRRLSFSLGPPIHPHRRATAIAPTAVPPSTTGVAERRIDWPLRSLQLPAAEVGRPIALARRLPPWPILRFHRLPPVTMPRSSRRRFDFSPTPLPFRFGPIRLRFVRRRGKGSVATWLMRRREIRHTELGHGQSFR